MARYWRIRLRNGDGEFSNEAWERNEIGIWYGAWSAQDFRSAAIRGDTDKQIAKTLDDFPAQKHLRDSVWHKPIPPGFVKTARRFFDRISEGDWAVMYLAQRQEIALAQMTGQIHSDPDHPLNTSTGELFKFRRIYNKKRFALADLPDVYRLVPAQGRGNVHAFQGMPSQVKLLAELGTTDEVQAAIGQMPFDEQLNFMGASAWESFCVAWLIMERRFVPTGLLTGRTLKDVDIVGRNSGTGKRIIAQCKKGLGRVAIDNAFIKSVRPGDEAYYFAYGGCAPHSADTDVCVFSRRDALKWSNTERGKLFQRLLLGTTTVC